MRIGCSITPSEVELAAECGFDYVELAGKVIAAMDEQEFTRLLKKLEKAQIPCFGFNAYCPREVIIAGPGTDPYLAYRYAQKLFPRAQALGIRRIGVGSPFSRMLPADYPQSRARGELVSFFRATGKVFAPAGVEVCVEALGHCYCNCINRVEEAIDIARTVDRLNVGVVVDFYNMEQEGEGDRVFYPKEAKWIRHAHISDDDGSPQLRSFLRSDKAFQHLERVQRLLSAGYAGDITLEIDVPLEKRRAEHSLAILRYAAQINE